MSAAFWFVALAPSLEWARAKMFEQYKVIAAATNSADPRERSFRNAMAHRIIAPRTGDGAEPATIDGPAEHSVEPQPRKPRLHL